jgi:hypothetical protein
MHQAILVERRRKGRKKRGYGTQIKMASFTSLSKNIPLQGDFSGRNQRKKCPLKDNYE